MDVQLNERNLFDNLTNDANMHAFPSYKLGHGLRLNKLWHHSKLCIKKRTRGAFVTMESSYFVANKVLVNISIIILSIRQNCDIFVFFSISNVME